MAFKKYRFDVRRLWATPANDAEAPSCVAKPDRKACRKRVKREMRVGKRSMAPRDLMRLAWVADRCGTCASCPKFLAKLGVPTVAAES